MNRGLMTMAGLVSLACAGTGLSTEPAYGETADGGNIRAGRAIYRDVCSACHGVEGGGVAGLFPSLQGSAIVGSPDPSYLIQLVLHGQKGVGTEAAPTAPAMPSFGGKLDNSAIAAVASYVRQAWGNAAPPVSPSVVAAQRDQKPE